MKLTTEFETKNDYEQARISFDTPMCQGIIMVGLDGWNYSKYDNRQPDRWGRSSFGLNVRMSMNGPLKLEINDWRLLNEAIEDAHAKLLDTTV